MHLVIGQEKGRIDIVNIHERKSVGSISLSVEARINDICKLSKQDYAIATENGIY